MAIDSNGFFFRAFHSPFPSVSNSTIFWYSGSFCNCLNLDSSFSSFRLKVLFMYGLPIKRYPLSSYIIALFLFTHHVRIKFSYNCNKPSWFVLAKQTPTFFSITSIIGDMSFINPLSPMKSFCNIICFITV